MLPEVTGPAARGDGDAARVPARRAPRPARLPPEALLAVIGAGAAAVLVLWWHGTPTLHGFGDWLTNAGRVTGLEAGYGVVMLVALMVRIPPVERGVGTHRL